MAKYLPFIKIVGVLQTYLNHNDVTSFLGQVLRVAMADYDILNLVLGCGIKRYFDSAILF